MNSDGQKRTLNPLHLPTVPVRKSVPPSPAAPVASEAAARTKRTARLSAFQQRVITLMAGPVIAAILIATVAGLLLMRIQQEESAKQHAAQYAHLIAAQVDDNVNTLAEVAEATHSRLFLVDGSQKIVEDSAALLEGQPFPIAIPTAGAAFTAIDGERHVVAGHPDDGDSDTPRLVVAFPASQLMPSWLTLLPYALSLALLSLLIGLVIALPRTTAFARPLEALFAAAAKISEGDFDARAEVPAEAGDLQRLARTFNLMANEMHAARSAQRDFLSSVSHDLRTPLNSIQGYSQFLKDGAVPIEETERVATIINHEATRLSRLIQDLLDLARIESGRLVMNQRSTTMNKVLGEAVADFATEAENAGVTVNLQVPRRTLPTHGDQERLKQALSTLIDQAIASAEKGGKDVTIEATLAGVRIGQRTTTPTESDDEGTSDLGRWWIEVLIRDNGPTLSAEERERLFERLRLLTDAQEAKLNVSLVVAREIIHAHGGDLTVHEGKDHSNELLLRLPMKMR